MGTGVDSRPWKWRATDWTAAAVAGFAAGAVLMVLDLIWSAAYAPEGPWRTAHMIAPIFTGPESLKAADYKFSVGIVALALATHYVLGIIGGLVMAAGMVQFKLDTMPGRAIVAGACFGAALYVINFGIGVRLFPWLAELRGAESFAANVVYGIVAALLYWRLKWTAKDPPTRDDRGALTGAGGGLGSGEGSTALAVALVLLLIGSVGFHFVSPWYFTPVASNWDTIDQTISITFWVTGIVFVAVGVFVAVALLRYRARAGHRAAYEPENKKLEWQLLWVTAVGVALMLAPGLFVWAKFVDVPKDAAVVEVVAQQWNWSYRMPGKDGKLGTVDTRFVTDQNPFGMNPGDARGHDDVLVSSPELHLPIGKPVKLLLRSKDVLHNFSVAQIRVKMDLVPGLVTYLWFTPTRTGIFDLLCEELCGIGHYAMRGRIVVDEPDAYQRWLDGQTTNAQALARVPGNAEAGKAAYATCAACHGAQGEGTLALNAPKLSGQGGWYLERQLKLFKQGARGTHDKDIFGKMMAPMVAALADDGAIADVAAYIATLPDVAAAATVKGDASRGRQRYVTCAACHGADGGGIAATNAPRLKGMSDWYMATQLKNFRTGVRGGHAQDLHGSQMALIAAMLADDAAVADIVAYIGTL